MDIASQFVDMCSKTTELLLRLSLPTANSHPSIEEDEENNSWIDRSTLCHSLVTVIVGNDDCGRYCVAARDISAGEVILREKALVVAPVMERVSPLYPTCLGCCCLTNTAYSCSRCHWPVCNKECEKILWHANFECKVFESYKVQPLPHPQNYQYIQTMRCLLSKERPQIMTLESHVISRSRDKSASKLSQAAYKFIRETCQQNFNFETVDLIFGACHINSFGENDTYKNRKRSRSLVFHKMSFFNHDCVPNTRLIFGNDSDCILMASVPIKRGQCITHQYINTMDATFKRQSSLACSWYFKCTCLRCTDPTELETYFSAVKCTNETCSSNSSNYYRINSNKNNNKGANNICNYNFGGAAENGYLLPQNPLEEKTAWLCNSCTNTKSTSEIVGICDKIRIDIITKERKLSGYFPLEEMLEEYSGTVLHVNHTLLIDLQYEIIDRFVSGFRRNPSQHSNLEFIERAVRIYCRNLLRIADVFCPGQKAYRGQLLYFLCFCVGAWSNVMGAAIDSSPCDLCPNYVREIVLKDMGHSLDDYFREAVLILSSEAQGSEYTTMAQELQIFFKENHLIVYIQ